MALGNKRNILVGAAAVFLGPAGIATPATVDRATWIDTAPPAPWFNAGYTQDGLEVASDPSYGEVEVDQLLDAPVIFKDGMGFSISTTFAEATLLNLMIAWGQSPDTLTSTATEERLVMAGGALGDAPEERGLIALGNGPKASGSNSYGERFYHAYNVLSVEGSGHTMARAEATVIPVTFRAMPNDDGDYGVVVDNL